MDFEDLLFQNAHWVEPLEVPRFRRAQFKVLEEGLKNRLIYSLYGIRRAGKTTLMKQLIAHLIEKGVEPENILYFSFDEAREEPKEVIDAWRARFSHNLKERGLYVFFDEVQKVEDWGSKLKPLYDNTSLKFYLSGSSSLIFKKGKESLAGREVEVAVEPLNFKEWMEIRGLRKETASYKLYEAYLFRQFPELAINPSLDAKQYVSAVINKIISTDIPSMEGISDPSALVQIFNALLKSPGQIVKYYDIAKDFGINRETASKYLNLLVDSFLLRKLYNFTPNARKSEKAAKKFYPSCTTLLAQVRPFPVDISLIIETDVAFQLGAEFFWHHRNREIDFLIGENLEIGVEVKARAHIDKSDVRALLDNPLNLRRKLLVTLPGSKVNVSGVEVVFPYNLADYAGH